MTELRQRRIEEMTIRRNYSPKTITEYVRSVARFAKHFSRPPDRLTPDHVREYQLHLIESGASWSRFNIDVCALKLFYGKILGHRGIVDQTPHPRKQSKLPIVLSREDVLRLPAGLPSLKHRTISSAGQGTEGPLHATPPHPSESPSPILGSDPFRRPRQPMALSRAVHSIR